MARDRQPAVSGPRTLSHVRLLHVGGGVTCSKKEYVAMQVTCAGIQEPQLMRMKYCQDAHIRQPHVLEAENHLELLFRYSQ